MKTRFIVLIALAGVVGWAYCLIDDECTDCDVPQECADCDVPQECADCDVPQECADCRDIAYEFDFADTDQGFGFGFADYTAGDEESMALSFARAALPEEVGPGHGLRISGHNRSDDLFMFVKKQITGLEPKTTYELAFELVIASNAAEGSIGIGGSPAHAVCLKAGATGMEPMAAPDARGFLQMNLDKGNQIMGGADMVVLGDFAKPSQGPEYELITRDNAAKPFTFTSGDSDAAWLVFGFDSGFEGTTTAYFVTIQVTFSAVAESLAGAK